LERELAMLLSSLVADIGGGKKDSRAEKQNSEPVDKRER
jgi:hypothetical protein